MGVNLHAKHAQIATFKKEMSFIFSHFLASFPLFSIFCSSLLCSPRRASPVFPSRPWVPALPCDKSSTIAILVGYRRATGMSSEKCRATKRQVAQFRFFRSATSPARHGATPHPSRFPMKCIGTAGHPLPKGEGTRIFSGKGPTSRLRGSFAKRLGAERGGLNERPGM